ncbi:MAG: hypothetical protein KAR83_07740 [Thermodesulfovibrionales bacterium]|nr:hypothetical protein [Thermodesulfovibrionales bacterium]
MKKNCWEYMKCGQESALDGSTGLSICPALREESLDGIHGGRNAGRACWVIAGTMCGGKPQGVFAEKFGRCVMCDFYKKVRSEEADFRLPGQLIDIVLTKRGLA